jgi:hypothetical protein
MPHLPVRSALGSGGAPPELARLALAGQAALRAPSLPGPFPSAPSRPSAPDSETSRPLGSRPPRLLHQRPRLVLSPPQSLLPSLLLLLLLLLPLPRVARRAALVARARRNWRARTDWRRTPRTRPIRRARMRTTTPHPATPLQLPPRPAASAPSDLDPRGQATAVLLAAAATQVLRLRLPSPPRRLLPGSKWAGALSTAPRALLGRELLRAPAPSVLRRKASGWEWDRERERERAPLRLPSRERRRGTRRPSVALRRPSGAPRRPAGDQMSDGWRGMGMAMGRAEVAT